MRSERRRAIAAGYAEGSTDGAEPTLAKNGCQAYAARSAHWSQQPSPEQSSSEVRSWETPDTTLMPTAAPDAIDGTVD
jgi:hypothetical protein